MSYDAAGLQTELSRRTGRRVRLILTTNRRRMISARNCGGGDMEVRLQRIFLGSSPEVLSDVAALLSGAKTSRAALRRFIDDRLGDAPPPPAPARRRPPPAEEGAGAVHDIAAYARDLNDIYLGGRSKAMVAWGRKGGVRSRRSIRFGCYDPERNRIIMNRKLDSSDIPDYFVKYILFHEMLHEVLGIDRRADGRRVIHGSLFRLMESTYPDFSEAQRFERDLCRRLGSL